MDKIKIGDTVLIVCNDYAYAYYWEWLSGDLQVHAARGEYPLEGKTGEVVQVGEHQHSEVSLLGVRIDGKVFIIEPDGVELAPATSKESTQYKLGDMVRIINGRDNFSYYDDWPASKFEDQFKVGISMCDGDVGTIVQIGPHLSEPENYGSLLGVQFADRFFIYEDVDVEMAVAAEDQTVPEEPPQNGISVKFAPIINMALLDLLDKLGDQAAQAHKAKHHVMADMYDGMVDEVNTALGHIYGLK